MTNFIQKFRDMALFTGRVRRLASPYFRSEDRLRAWSLLLAIVALNLGSVYLAVLLNDWNRVFYDALQDKNSTVFWQQMGRFTYLAFALIVVAVYKFYLTQLLELRWRQWMTTSTLKRWMSHNAYYQLELLRFSEHQGSSSLPLQAPPDNPDQRIAQDVSLFTSQTVGLCMGLLNASVTLVSFVGILWALSGGLAFDMLGTHFNIPGYMVWVAVLYCLAGSLLTHWIGRPLIGLNFQQEKVEADFRHHLIRVRESAEVIALDKGAGVEQTQLSGRFTHVLTNYLALIKAQKRLIWFTSFFGQVAIIFPFLVTAPRFFSGAIQLGELMQIASAFGKVQDSLSWFVDNYDSLASWRATTDRLVSFEDSLQKAESPGAITRTESANKPDDGVRVQDLSLTLPNQNLLLTAKSLQLAPGDRILIQGASGSGKSTLLRALAGIWPFGSGHVQVPADAMFLPQKPYIGQGSLRAALAYPASAEQYGDEALKAALQQALLPHLVDQLDREDAWSQKLSGGEQQRLAIARAFLKQPRWLFADEATSALDLPTQAALYPQLLAMVQARNGGLVSISHQTELAAYHTKVWDIRERAVLERPIQPLAG